MLVELESLREYSPKQYFITLDIVICPTCANINLSWAHQRLFLGSVYFKYTEM